MVKTFKIRMNLLGFVLSFLLKSACQPPIEVEPSTGPVAEVAGDVVREATAEVRESGGAIDQEDGSAVGLANSAALYCQDLGCSVEPRQNAAGMDAACIFLFF